MMAMPHHKTEGIENIELTDVRSTPVEGRGLEMNGHSNNGDNIYVVVLLLVRGKRIDKPLS